MERFQSDRGCHYEFEYDAVQRIYWLFPKDYATRLNRHLTAKNKPTRERELILIMQLFAATACLPPAPLKGPTAPAFYPAGGPGF